ncbi:glycerophosphodiester phosphodiesterase [Devosia geojensis]|uniref:Glycerophosphodiester phosphodiesterase n=1 Tax=Devosia geojensis TaxID=443610 RepID=A0A0F5FRS3_9HYPH|nr:glycerophosphodiester phosphodiesterase family protein [Devosia geojensis]KKB11551.1 glycerophosphodiester phosphodiesterase [Devosia geojensis]
MHSDIYIERNGHRTWLKWHRARRRGSDPVFTGRRILEGMAAGASVEVDLVVHADKGMAVLHDLTLERETTGAGLVRETSAEVLRSLNLRGNDGAPLPDKVMLLEDLAALLARDGSHPDALLQLDYKEDAGALDPETIASFTTALAPVGQNFILSSGDAEAVDLLSANLPDLNIGYDPCHGDALARLSATGDFAGFVAEAVAASPRADLIYLAYPAVLEAEARGFDLIAAFHAAGRRIDAYTIQRADDGGVAVAERLLALKVDQITTDDPEGLGAALARETETA